MFFCSVILFGMLKTMHRRDKRMTRKTIGEVKMTTMKYKRKILKIKPCPQLYNKLCYKQMEAPSQQSGEFHSHTHTHTTNPHTHLHREIKNQENKYKKKKQTKNLKKKTNKREYYSNKKWNTKFLFTKMSFYYRLISVNGPSLWPPRRGRPPQFMSRCFWQFYSHLGWRLLSPFGSDSNSDSQFTIGRDFHGDNCGYYFCLFKVFGKQLTIKWAYYNAIAYVTIN